MSLDAVALAEDMLSAADEAVQRALHPLLIRLAMAEGQIAVLTAALAHKPADGAEGPQGATGERGEPGMPGPTGERGPAGERGEPGAVGPAGADGVPGERGEMGPQGPAGERGAEGPVGQQGERGPAGEPGHPGRDGAPGPAGEKGEPGERGPAGETGAPGPVGERGSEGPAGQIGLPGERGPEGRLPRAMPWEDRVHRDGDVVTSDGALWQAQRDTGKAPPHADWLLLAGKGADGAGFRARGTFDASAFYVIGDVVALGGSSFVATADAPGLCPGDGWQLLASRGSKGPQGERGLRGERGDPGRDAEAIVAFFAGEDGVPTLTLASGTELRMVRVAR